MRTRNLFLLLALTLLCAACDKQNEGDTPKPEEYDVRMEAKYLLVEYWGDEFTPGVDNYSVIIAENEFKMDLGGGSLTEGSYYCLDLYAPVTEDGELPEGTYTFDTTESCAEWTIDGTVGGLIMVDAEGNFITDEEGIIFSDATLVVKSESAELTAVIEGKTHYVTFSGKFAKIDSTNDSGDVIRSTTLTNDVTVEGSNAMFVAETGEAGAYILVMENYGEEGAESGAMFMLEIALAEGSTSISGTYSVEDGTLNIGTYDNHGMWGSWYFDTVDGELGQWYAAIQSGSVTFTQEGDTCAMTLDCSDEEGYSIKATLSGMLVSDSYVPEAFVCTLNR
ncbi:MAG: hypothetical protein E7135_01625 [Rikenellaceae bacterium]|nr:hypothetical protein [Rikenellaceae bacterium]